VEEGETKLYMFLTRSNLTGKDCVLLLSSLSLQVIMSDPLKLRWGHSTTAFCLVDGVTEVTMFGGSADPLTGSDKTVSKLADTILLQFCKYMNYVYTWYSMYL